MQVVVLRDAAELAEAAAAMFREHLAARPDLAMAVPAGRTPRRMYARLREGDTFGAEPDPALMAVQVEDVLGAAAELLS